MKVPTVTWWLGGVGAVLMLMATVPAETAAANIASYLKLLSPALDRVKTIQVLEANWSITNLAGALASVLAASLFAVFDKDGHRRVKDLQEAREIVREAVREGRWDGALSDRDRK